MDVKFTENWHPALEISMEENHEIYRVCLYLDKAGILNSVSNSIFNYVFSIFYHLYL